MAQDTEYSREICIIAGLLFRATRQRYFRKAA
jgi:hypothetical protein